MDNRLFICGIECTGRQASARDPLAQNTCPLVDVHTPADRTGQRCARYLPRVVDGIVAAEVLCLPGSKCYLQRWGHDYDPEEVVLE